MAKKESASDNTETTDQATADAAAADAVDNAQAVTDDWEAQGYIGTKPDPHPNEAYSLQTGPTSPSTLEANGRLAQHALGADTEGAK